MEEVFMSSSVRLFLTIVVIVILIYTLIKFRAYQNNSSSSLDMMKQRFERGEISKEAYERAKKQQGKDKDE